MFDGGSTDGFQQAMKARVIENIWDKAGAKRGSKRTQSCLWTDFNDVASSFGYTSNEG
jgi:hypothetical protein